jgi:hypothetical protein
MRELRAISTRVAISRTSFSNYYTFGDLKADPRDLLVKYFDASLYFANWLFLEIAFRYPKGVVDVKAIRRQTAGMRSRFARRHRISSWLSRSKGTERVSTQPTTGAAGCRR